MDFKELFKDVQEAIFEAIRDASEPDVLTRMRSLDYMLCEAFVEHCASSRAIAAMLIDS